MAVIRNPNARIFQDRISGAASKLLEEFNPLRVVNTAVLKPNFDEWVGDEVKETAKITSPLAKSNSYIFIGYASDDGKEYATLIHDILDEMKVNNWISLNGFETRNRYGEDWREQIIPQAEIAFIVVTSSSPNSRSIRVELDLALEKGVPVILLIAPNTDLNTLDELVSAIPSENTIPVIELDSVDRSSIQASIIAVMPTITSADFTLYPSSTTTLDRLISSQRAAAKSKDDPKAIDVFISYARKDGAEHAARLQAELTKLSLSVWLDMNFVTLQDFSVEIEKAIKRADIVLVLLTSDVNRRDSFVQREISYALALNKRIILLSFEDIIPPISIANLTRIDFFRDWDSGFERLKDVLGIRSTVGKTLENTIATLSEVDRQRFTQLGAMASKPATFDQNALIFIWQSDQASALSTIDTFLRLALIQEVSPNRYQAHELVVNFAKELVVTEKDQPSKDINRIRIQTTKLASTSFDTIQVDYAEVERINRRIVDEQTQLDELLKNIHRRVEFLQGGAWRGSSAEAFYSEMESVIFPRLHRLKNALEQTSGVLRQALAEFHEAENAAQIRIP